MFLPERSRFSPALFLWFHALEHFIFLIFARTGQTGAAPCPRIGNGFACASHHVVEAVLGRAATALAHRCFSPYPELQGMNSRQRMRPPQSRQIHGFFCRAFLLVSSGAMI